MTAFTCLIRKINEFGGAELELTSGQLAEKGIDFGDTLDLRFSSGTFLENIPYYNGYYVPMGEPVLVSYPGYSHPAVNYNCGNLSQKTGTRAGDSVTVTLNRKGAKKDVMDLRSVVYSNDRGDYPDRDSFANAREFCVGEIAPRKIYRCASPFDNIMNRPEAVDDFLREHSVKTTFSLSESDQTLRHHYTQMPPYAKHIYETGFTVPLGLGSGYFTKEFQSALAKGLVRVCDLPFPIAIHCLEGKDRTGFVCILLGALMGAEYRELLDDYMKTYENYYGITKKSDPTRYNLFRSIFIDTFLRIFAGLREDEDPEGHDYRNGAEKYLRAGGMTAQEIEVLKMTLEK